MPFSLPRLLCPSLLVCALAGIALGEPSKEPPVIPDSANPCVCFVLKDGAGQPCTYDLIESAAIAFLAQEFKGYRVALNNDDKNGVSAERFPRPLKLLRHLFLYAPDKHLQAMILRFGLDGGGIRPFAELAPIMARAEGHTRRAVKEGIYYLKLAFGRLPPETSWEDAPVSIKELALSPRTEIILMRDAGIVTLRQLQDTTDEQLRNVAHFERGRVDEVVAALTLRALTLKQPLMSVEGVPVPQLKEMPELDRLAVRVDSLSFSQRFPTFFKKYNIITVADLRNRSSTTLLEYPLFGEVMLAEVRQRLNAIGFKLQDD